MNISLWIVQFIWFKNDKGKKMKKKNVRLVCDGTFFVFEDNAFFNQMFFKLNKTVLLFIPKIEKIEKF